MILANHGIVSSSGASFDTDALAFITAASITDNTQKTAINTLVTDLKSYNIWTKMKALYPFVGGSASSHKWNLKDPRDLDAAYRLVFNGGWTHSNTGALPNGTTAYADTKFTPSVDWSINNIHTSFYSKSNISLTSTQVLIDAFVGAGSNYQFYFDSSASKIVHDAFSSTNGRASENISVFSSRTDGLFIGTRTSATNNTIYRNSTSIVTSTTTNDGTLPYIPLFISAANTTAGAVAFSSLESSFASIGEGLTSTQATNLSTAINTFNTILSR